MATKEPQFNVGDFIQLCSGTVAFITKIASSNDYEVLKFSPATNGEATHIFNEHNATNGKERYKFLCSVNDVGNELLKKLEK